MHLILTFKSEKTKSISLGTLWHVGNYPFLTFQYYTLHCLIPRLPFNTFILISGICPTCQKVSKVLNFNPQEYHYKFILLRHVGNCTFHCLIFTLHFNWFVLIPGICPTCLKLSKVLNFNSQVRLQNLFLSNMSETILSTVWFLELISGICPSCWKVNEALTCLL